MSEARRLIMSGAIHVNDARVTDPYAEFHKLDDKVTLVWRKKEEECEK
jgi:ribosomal protein S4